MPIYGTSRGITTFYPRGWDPNAVTYLNTAGIINDVERLAVNRLIQRLKYYSLWNIFDCLYLFSPTSLAAALYCAKTLTQMTAVNNPTFSSQGITFDGLTQYLDTGIQTGNLVQSTTSSSHQCTYTNGAFLGNGVTGNLQGSVQTISSNTCRWLSFEDGTNNVWVPRLYLTVLSGSSLARANGCILGSRVSSASTFVAFRNSTTLTTTGASAAASGASPTTNRVFIGAASGGGFSTPTGFVKQTIAFISFGGSLTTSQSSLLTFLVQQYQVALRRSV